MIASLSKGSLLEEVIHGGLNEQQLTTYVSWVNCQLRKKPGLRPITDLRHDLQDGVVLTHLIEIVAGEVLEGVHLAPRDPEERRENVERVLQFITSKHIRMPNTSARDIVDGNLKSVMRMILALAAHFKPSANHRAGRSGRGSGQHSANHSPLSTIALAQGAAAALATARHDASQLTRHTRLHSLSSISPLSSPRAPLPSQSPHKQEDNCEQSQLWADSLNETLEKEIQETHRMVSTLQALLLHGSLPEDEQEAYLILEDGNAHQQVVVLQSRLDQSMEDKQEIKRELLRCKEDLRTLQGAKEAQQRRLCVQETSILQMRQELLRSSMMQEQLNSQNAELQRKLEERTRQWSECQIPTNSQNNGYSHCGNPSASLSGGEELQLVKEAVRSLRGNFRDHDPQQHTLDTLEQGIASLTDRLRVLQTYQGRGKSPGRKAIPADTCTSTKVCHSNSSSAVSTKVLYFTGHSATPSMTHIPKRLGEVTLRDVKAAVDREGNYRYHFKALDPEFGTVKEEVLLDEALIPGWEGKIVTWLERPEMGDTEDPVERQRAVEYSERRIWTDGRVDPL